MPACNSCPTMRAQTTGAAVMGNGDFSLDLVNAPSNASTYALAIGIGGCSSPGVGLGFCENAFVSLTAPGPLVFFFSPTSFPAPTCNGTQRLSLPIPVDQALCNFEVSFQWVVQCRGNPVGNGVSNCVTFRVNAI